MAVRILPMDRAGEFPNCASAAGLQQQFFLQELPHRPNGAYRYRSAGLRAEPDTLILFQSDGAIIASASLNGSERFVQPDHEGYRGALYFVVDSIRVFEPMTLAEMQAVWPKIRRLGHVKWDLDPNGIPAFEMALRNVETPQV